MTSLIPGAPPSGYGFSGSWDNDDPFDSSEDVNPLANMTNLVDAMLVLAVGIMVALVTLLGAHQVNYQELMKEDLSEIDNPEEIADDIYATDSPYQELGKVYMDPETGKTYVMTEDGSSEETDVDWQGASTSESTSASESTNGDANGNAD